MNNKIIKVLSPATVANVACGFDVLGFALNDINDELVMRIIPKRGVTIINKDDFNLPVEPKQNVIGISLLALLEEIEDEIGFEVKSTKHIRPGSGIGSSAASAAGAVFGANHLLNNRFTNDDLIRFAMQGEELASGAKHADNIAPCIYGGFTLIRSNDPLDIIPIPAPFLYVTIIHPQIEIKTSDARSVLKRQVLLADAVKQWGNVGGLIAGLMKNDYELISRSLVDNIVEPIRSILIPCFDEVKSKSLAAGALGGGISGSGPSMFMISKDQKMALEIEKIAKKVYEKIGLPCHTYVTNLNKRGVQIQEMNELIQNENALL
ncbi:MAG: homoserine kinase [Flavobacteriia bacterium]|nr:homoserine kinase [Flavobacteriia bacterium]